MEEVKEEMKEERENVSLRRGTLFNKFKVKLWGGISAGDRTFWGFTIIALFRQVIGLLGLTWFFGLPFSPWKLWGQAVGSATFVVIVAHFFKIREVKFIGWVLLVALIGLSTFV